MFLSYVPTPTDPSSSSSSSSNAATATATTMTMTMTTTTTEDTLDLNLTAFSDQSIYEQIRSRLAHCFERKLSSSMMLFGENEEAQSFVYRAIQSFDQIALSCTTPPHRKAQEEEGFHRIAVLKAHQIHSDAEGLLCIANQLLLRRVSDKELNAALEDLEQYFTQCRMDGIPAILILEDFHVFAMKKRQMLIYTLLDFMHKRELLFMVSLS